MLPLENRGNVVLFPTKTKGCSLLQMVQTDTGAHPISFQCALGIDFCGGKAAEGVRLITHHLVLRLGISATYMHRPPFASMTRTGTPLPLPYNYAWILCRITSFCNSNVKSNHSSCIRHGWQTCTYIRITLVCSIMSVMCRYWPVPFSLNRPYGKKKGGRKVGEGGTQL